MTTYQDLKDFFAKQNLKVIIVADAQTRGTAMKNGKVVTKIPAGGVAVALDPIAKAGSAVYISKGKDELDKKLLNADGKLKIEDTDGSYTLKRLFFSQKDSDDYYLGFSNQTLWPLCHVTFEQPIFRDSWYEGYKRVNKIYAETIKKELNGKRTFIWLNDYQLCLVPAYLSKPKNAIVGFFWHIPWPTWEIFRILPQKKEILESLLLCDFIAFHRGYQARNFIQCVERELEVRVDDETGKIYYKNHVTTVKNLPLGIDADVIQTLAKEEKEEDLLTSVVRTVLGVKEKKNGKSAKKYDSFHEFFTKHKVILGVDRLDYTKGLVLRLLALEKFFDDNPKYLGNVVYLGIMAPSREKIPSYAALRKKVKEEEIRINHKFAHNNWKPINIIYDVFARDELIHFYENSAVCLVTPRDDGMNLVSKEFVLASSESRNPGMLVLSTFAGSAIDLTKSLIVNPYDIDQVAKAIRTALEMRPEERKRRIKDMADVLHERNVYEWAEQFVRSSVMAVR